MMQVMRAFARVETAFCLFSDSAVGSDSCGAGCADRWDCLPVVVLAKVARIDGAGRVLASVALTLALVMLAAVAQTVGSARCGAG